jgi:hypothetical protein
MGTPTAQIENDMASIAGFIYWRVYFERLLLAVSFFTSVSVHRLSVICSRSVI